MKKNITKSKEIKREFEYSNIEEVRKKRQEAQKRNNSFLFSNTDGLTFKKNH
jgi:hypothetical protein